MVIRFATATSSGGVSLAACFDCLTTFSPSNIAEWLDETSGAQTALCPKCVNDTVIGDASGYPLTPEFLGEMHAHWCENDEEEE